MSAFEQLRYIIADRGMTFGCSQAANYFIGILVQAPKFPTFFSSFSLAVSFLSALVSTLDTDASQQSEAVAFLMSSFVPRVYEQIQKRSKVCQVLWRNFYILTAARTGYGSIGIVATSVTRDWLFIYNNYFFLNWQRKDTNTQNKDFRAVASAQRAQWLLPTVQARRGLNTSIDKIYKFIRQSVNCSCINKARKRKVPRNFKLKKS